MRRLTIMRRALLAATPFAVVGALYVSGKNQILGLVVIGAFFAIALRFSRIQDKVEAQAKAAADAGGGAGTA